MSYRPPAARIHEIDKAPKAMVAGQRVSPKKRGSHGLRRSLTDGRDRSPKRSGECKANEVAHDGLENHPMASHSRAILADRPEVGPCLRPYFRQSLSFRAYGKVDGLVKMRFAMTTFAAPLTPETVRQLLHAFWQESLEIAKTRQGLSLSLPQTYPDGWQIVVDLEDHLPEGLKATDQGRTLGWLVAHGQNIETDAVQRYLDEICVECGIERDGLELFHWLPKDLEGVDLHVFAEALVAIAHLHYLSDLKPRTLDIPDEALQRVNTQHDQARLIDARKLSLKEDGDEIFEALPSVSNPHTQIDLFPDTAHASKSNDPMILWGVWPGDEPLEELMAKLS
jgi:hypothetical protein